MPTLWVVLGTLGAVLVLAASRVSVLSQRLKRVQEEALAEQLELSSLRRELGQLSGEHRFLSQFIREFPHLTRELHAGVRERRIPQVLLNIVMRVLEPRQAVVFVRRRRAASDPARTSRLVLAASSPLGALQMGMELALGEGEVGLAGDLQLVMDRRDFDAQPPAVRSRLRHTGIRGFTVDLAAPLLFAEETLGVIAVEQPSVQASDTKNVLRLVAQVGALALRSAQAYAEMRVSANVDGLTRVYNKRHLGELLSENIHKIDRDGGTLTLFLFDIDNFKHYNDANGHVAGDGLLRDLARLVEENTRKETVFGRFGGEEFLMLFPGCAQEVLPAAEKVRALIAGYPFPFSESQPLGAVTVSGGVAEYPRDARDSTALVKAADKALYKSKQAGRNRVQEYVFSPNGSD